MFIYTPYTYLIGWSNLDRWYYGVRFAKDCHPTDLWESYFTSSKFVADFRKTHGEPDIVQIRKTFDCSDKAKQWENNVLKKMKVVQTDRWLNKTASYSFPLRDIRGNKNPMRDPKVAERVAEKLRGREGVTKITETFDWYCEYCGKCIIRRNTAKMRKKRFCNKSCAGKSKKGQKTRKTYKFICGYCKKEQIRTPDKYSKGMRFCSHSCSRRARLP